MAEKKEKEEGLVGGFHNWFVLWPTIWGCIHGIILFLFWLSYQG